MTKPTMNILINAVGSHGDVLPFIALGRELRRRGHHPHLFANETFEAMAKQADLDFSATGTAADMARYMEDRDATDPMKGMALLAKAMMQSVRQTYPLLKAAHVPGNTVVVGSSLAWAARLIRETHAVPGVVVHLAPSWFRSEHVAPSVGPLGQMAWAPAFVKRGVFAMMDKRFLDPLFTDPFNRIRADAGLPPVRRTFDVWMHQADRVLAMFAPWFAPAQPDWPKNLTFAGFPLYDHGSNTGLAPEVADYLAAGDAPVVFTAGTANASSHAFFAASVEASQRSGHRAILLTQDTRQLPATLPAGIVHFRYVPFQTLLPGVAAFVHHGGIGTTSHALLAGVPQLIRPMGFDQFDNARRAISLGVAEQIMPSRYTARSAARALQRLTTSDTVKARCTQAAARMTSSHGVNAACDAILDISTQATGHPVRA